jgi:hypothetical protein
MAKTRRHKKTGGAFLANGADTCVYDPPLMCNNLPPGWVMPPNHVSRVVDSFKEPKFQQALKAILKQVDAQIPSKPLISSYFNVGTIFCSTFTLTKEDIRHHITGKSCPKTHANGMLRQAVHITGEDKLFNIITPKQKEDVAVNGVLSRSKELTAPGLGNLLMALVDVGGEFIHIDAHFGNLAWKYNDSINTDMIVMHDWGRAVVFGNGSIVYEEISKFIDQPEDYTDSYPQLKYPFKLLREIISKKRENEQSPISLGGGLDELDEYEDIEFERTMYDVRRFIHPRNYARVYDILSIMGSMVKYDIVTEGAAIDVYNAIRDEFMKPNVRIETAFLKKQVLSIFKKCELPTSGGRRRKTTRRLTRK